MKKRFIATLLALGLTIGFAAADGRNLAAGGGQTATSIFGFAGSSGPAGQNPDPQGHIHLRNVLLGYTIEARVVCVFPFSALDALGNPVGAATLIGEVTRVSGTVPGVAMPQTIRIAALDTNPDFLSLSISDVPAGTPSPGTGICNNEIVDPEPVIRGDIVIHGSL